MFFSGVFKTTSSSYALWMLLGPPEQFVTLKTFNSLTEYGMQCSLEHYENANYTKLELFSQNSAINPFSLTSLLPQGE